MLRHAYANFRKPHARFLSLSSCLFICFSFSIFLLFNRAPGFFFRHHQHHHHHPQTHTHTIHPLTFALPVCLSVYQPKGTYVHD